MASVAHKAKEKRNKRRKRLGKPGAVSKYQNRCQICGRSHGHIRRFKVCRICFRKLAMNGELPGVKKASW